MGRFPVQQPIGLIGTRVAAMSAGLMVLAGVGAVMVNTFGHVNVARAGVPIELVIILGSLVGILAIALPWPAWGRRSTLVLIPVLLLSAAVINDSNPQTLTAGIFFVVIAMWIGLCHRPHTAAWCALWFAAAFWWPMRDRADAAAVVIATATVTMVSVAVGELLSALSTRLDSTHRRLLESRERRFSALVERSADVTMLIEGDGTIAYVSPAVTDVFGYEPSDLIGQPLSDVLDASVSGLAADVRDAILRQPVAGASRLADHPDPVEVRLLHTDGRWIEAEAVAQDRFDDPDLEGLVVNLRDIHQRKGLERELTHLAFHDELTGLANRSMFRARVAERLADDDHASVIFFDLDGFKVVNDTAGHQRGDELLVLVAQRISAITRADDLLARFGGDEFAMLLASQHETRSAAVAARIIDALCQPFTLGETQIVISASAGIAESVGGETADELIRDADTAMYEAKASDTASVAWYEPQMRHRVLARLDTETRLRAAIEREELLVHYQPKVDLRTGRLHGTEALVRWNDPVRGIVAPGEFIHIAEDSGLIVPLGQWVLETACREAASWQSTGGAGRPVAVNVSPRQFADPRLLDHITGALSDSGLAPELLTMEITESVVVSDIDSAARRLHALRDLGICLALDDFGTGYSSLRYLQRLPFDLLKIDRSFITHATTRSSDRSLVGTINRLGHDLGLATLAEGIETLAQSELLAELGCDYAQGYLFSRSVPVEELAPLWDRTWSVRPVATASPTVGS